MAESNSSKITIAILDQVIHNVDRNTIGPTFSIMARHPSKTDALLRLAARGPVRARDLQQAGVPRAYLRRLCDRGVLEKVDRGLYRLTSGPLTAQNSLAEVAKRVPNGTVCLLSALQLHRITTESPHAVWILIDRRARTPKLTYPSIEVIRASGLARDHGVEIRTFQGVPVRVTSPAKTVADCFRYRRRIGLEIALAALRDFLQKSRRSSMRRPAKAQGRKTTDAHSYSVDALLQAARADRVGRLVRPYVEALV